MQIDWFTYIAQIINFAILVWLLKRFLYRPIITAMDEREAGIARRVQESEAAIASARETRSRYEAQLDELTASREKMHAEVSAEVENYRNRQLQEVRLEISAAQEQWHRSLAGDRQSLIREIQFDAARHATEVGRHLLAELADASLQTQMISRFLRELNMCNDELMRTSDSREVIIVVSEAPGKADEARLRAAIRQRMPSADVTIRVNSDIVAGVELQFPDRRLAWSIRESLAELESELVDMIDRSLPSTNLPGLTPVEVPA